MPPARSSRVESACGPGTGWISRASGALTIRADVARPKGNQAQAEAYGVHKACCGSRFNLGVARSRAA